MTATDTEALGEPDDAADGRDVVVRSKRNGHDALPSGKIVGAVASAIAILRYLNNAPGPLGVTKIAADTRINTSTCFNILKTLASEGLVDFNPLNKTYAISLGILDLARGATALGADIETARPRMEQIAHDHGLTLTLWQPIGEDRKVLVMGAMTRSAIRIQMAIGQRLPRLIGATGRCFAAFSRMTEEEQRRQFDRIRWNVPMSYNEFREQVAETARTGWSRDVGNFASGTLSIALPVLDKDGVAVMAVTATMFAGQYDDARTSAIVEDLRGLSALLSRIAAAA